MAKFKKVLIANRGEIAVRIIRACQELGIGTVAVHSTEDSQAMFVKLADESVCIGPAPASESYLDKSAILSVATITGADAVHPGYGFLSEKADFVEMLEDHGITFIGPTSKLISKMGDKVEAKRTAESCGLPVVPGSDGDCPDLDTAIKVSKKIGYPVILKARSGGGGKGIHVVNNETELKYKFPIAKAEAKASFDDEAVYIEKFLTHPKHIEIQILADNFGNVVTLGERDCSLQRKHQKVMEEAPAIVLDNKIREDICEKIRLAVKHIGYTNAGTIEFMYQDGKFYFMEMNTRLQVEHPISEMISGVDIVREQLMIAMGEKLSITQEDIKLTGHAIEFRINAEDPETFIPWPGTITNFHTPGGLGVRVDSGVYSGYKIPSCYDSLLAKLIIYAEDRDTCLARAKHALNEFVIEGVRTNIPLHKELISQKDIVNGAKFDNNWLEHWIEKKHSDLEKSKAKEQEEKDKKIKQEKRKTKSDLKKLKNSGVTNIRRSR